ncbi:hypothetical protein AJ79_00469 [Helicocarpus griseus UAMH5409]|uniref:T6SS Phospholipase effector Tle1-like catalytic domain-containing protein n=1 Tax=Helicocarpus griseus UAMH5409 TaxID=1447875 RepID=A0A2B7YBH8_9EURO|nr:hypothetical protein AJ79_00469 [Helicocarpus griseus UAMH5409]
MTHHATDVPKSFVLCFDGTGNKFNGDESDSNVLKIFRMLDRNQGQQFHYYQPGIGTYITSANVPSQSGAFSRIKRSWIRIKDTAIGSSFDQHVIAGYKFLMRYYTPGDDIYFFGFSRGAYIARFLAEMLDYIGLLTVGNEELVQFAWKTFSKWQRRTGSSKKELKKRSDLYNFMKAFRETFSRPIRRIRFLGLFDTVNSVPKFESPWMSRRFPYTARSTAKFIRHAVAIDERRAKFRQDLISQNPPPKKRPGRHRRFSIIPHSAAHEKTTSSAVSETVPEETASQVENNGMGTSGNVHPKTSDQPTYAQRIRPEEDCYRPSYSHRSTHNPSLSTPDNRNLSVDYRSSVDSVNHHLQALQFTDDRSVESDQTVQDIQEVWFPGCHADIGGGWKLRPGEEWPLSHAPLVWMIHEAQRAGLQFDERKLKRFECSADYSGDYSPIQKSWSFDQAKNPDQPDIVIDQADGSGSKEAQQDGMAESASSRSFHEALKYASIKGHIHDSLLFNRGPSAFSVIAWNIMEYLPFRRMDLQEDGTWAPIRWPLPRGEVRDIPLDAQIHCSAIHRLKENPIYRPGNLIIGGGGRGVRIAPKDFGIGEWEVLNYEGDAVRGTYIRARKSKNGLQEDKVIKIGTPKNGKQKNGTQKNGMQKNGMQKIGN